MSAYEKLSLLCSLLGLLVAIIGFYFIVRQIKQVNSSIKSNTNNSLYSLTIDINKFLIENPNLRPYFYGDAEGKQLDYDFNHPHFHQIETLADIYITFWEYIFEERNNLGEELFRTWEKWIQDIYNKSPAIQKHIRTSKKWYKKSFVQSLS